MTSKAAAELGRRGGSATSKKKADAARANGKLGGRPVGKKKSFPQGNHKSTRQSS